MRIALALFTVAALAACERTGAPKTEESPAAPIADIREVAAADGYGEPGEKVNAVAVWSHPSVNFESLVLAASDAGVKAYRFEDGGLVATSETGASAIAIFYLGSGRTAQGYALTREEGAYGLYAVDNEAPALARLQAVGDAPGGEGFCASGGVIYEVGGGALNWRDISLLAGGATIGEARKIADTSGGACHVDERTGDVIIVSDDGGIKRINPTTGESFGLAFAAADPDASAAFLMTTPEPENAAGGAVLTLDGKSGVVSLYDLTDGHALGAVRIKSTYDLDAVASATTIAAGYGNYGGVYRDGALIVVTANDGPPIRIAPWAGVLDALSLPLGEVVDPRAPQAAEDDDGFLSIELEQP